MLDKVKFVLLLSFVIVSLSSLAQGPFASRAGTVGTSAIYKDSSVFVAWANKIEVQRGKQNIATPSSDTTTVGTWRQGIGKAKGTVISLGDSGVATLQFNGLIYNGVGPDFAVFENAFNHTFLELAFVEVSSNGVDFYRFPSESLTDTSTAVGSFGMLNPTNIHNLAGKYTVNYGTPFDLDDLDSISQLDVNAISHVRVVDVIGSLASAFAQRDSKNRKVNDQYPTPFQSGGFDLDAVGVIYMKGVGLTEAGIELNTTVYPNPSNGLFFVDYDKDESLNYQLFSIEGKKIQEGELTENQLDFREVNSGYYFLHLFGEQTSSTITLVIQ
ncbi:MAG: hypothetical protein ACI9DK_001897 [Vicingaceae bacterium]